MLDTTMAALTESMLAVAMVVDWVGQMGRQLDAILGRSTALLTDSMLATMTVVD
jgi:hypothetical protein